MVLIIFSQISSHMKQKEREKSARMELIPLPTGWACSKEGWEAGIKKRRQTWEEEEKKRVSIAAFLFPILWLGHCRCPAQEAHPLPTASQFLLRRLTDTQKSSPLPHRRNRAKKEQRTQALGRRGYGGERGITQDAMGVLDKDSDTTHSWGKRETK